MFLKRIFGRGLLPAMLFSLVSRRDDAPAIVRSSGARTTYAELFAKTSKLAEAFPDLTTDAQRAVAFVRSLPRVTSALVGMKSPAHLREQLAAVAR